MFANRYCIAVEVENIYVQINRLEGRMNDFRDEMIDREAKNVKCNYINHKNKSSKHRVRYTIRRIICSCLISKPMVDRPVAKAYTIKNPCHFCVSKTRVYVRRDNNNNNTNRTKCPIRNVLIDSKLDRCDISA